MFDLLAELELSFVRFETVGTSKVEIEARAEAVRQFDSGEVNLIVVSLVVGGLGLSLPSGRFTIVLGQMYNPQVLIVQAAGRIRRMGSNNGPTNHYLVCGAGEVTGRMLDIALNKLRFCKAIEDALREKNEYEFLRQMENCERQDKTDKEGSRRH